MSKQLVKIIYSAQEDANNWARFLSRKNPVYGIKTEDLWKFGNPKLSKSLKRKTKAQISKILFKKLTEDKTLIKSLGGKQKKLEKSWYKIEDKYFKVLSKVTAKPIYSKRFNASLTTYYMCPYNIEKKWFMVGVNKPLATQRLTIAHEIMHLQFIHHYYSYCKKKGLNDKQFEDIKESLTVLLNRKPFRDILKARDKGYAPHRKLRDYIAKECAQSKDFETLLNKSIRFILKSS